MPTYKLPKIELPKLKTPKFSFPKFWKNKFFGILLLTIFVSSFFGLLSGALSGGYFYWELKDYLLKFNIELPGPKVIENQSIIEKQSIYIPQTSQEEATIKVVNDYSPAVVSIIITKNVPILEQYYDPFFGIIQYRQNGTEQKEVGEGTGFIISEDGMIITNAHVVSAKEASFVVLTNDGKKYPAKVLGTDSARDLAIVKIEKEKLVDQEGNITFKPFPMVKLGDSDKLQIGQTVIAIGNALGEYRNTVSVGVISGLGRTVTASDSSGGMSETLEDVIQTDAAINSGNSGGPLLNLKGEVIGVNFATTQQAQSIGFAIPINKAKKDIERMKTVGKISLPFLGVRYTLINEEIQLENKLPVSYGALIQKGSQGEPAVAQGSAAQSAGLKEGDIILELNGEKITTENKLTKIIMQYNPGDKVTLKVLRDGKEQMFNVTLGERSG